MKKLRGPTYIGIILDELAFFFVEETLSNPDTEIIAACTPGLLTTRGMTVMASSPYAKKGVLWDTYRKHFGPNGSASVLVAHGTSRQFNPTIPEAEIARLLEKTRSRTVLNISPSSDRTFNHLFHPKLSKPASRTVSMNARLNAASATTASLILAAGVLTHSPCASATCLTGRKPS